MNSNDSITDENVYEIISRTLWVGNLEPDITIEDLTELFIQAGPIDFILLHVNGWIVFKYACSVNNSLTFFIDNKLFGLQLKMKKCWLHLNDPYFQEELNCIKNVIRDIYNYKSNECSDEIRLNDLNLLESFVKCELRNSHINLVKVRNQINPRSQQHRSTFHENYTNDLNLHHDRNYHSPIKNAIHSWTLFNDFFYSVQAMPNITDDIIPRYYQEHDILPVENVLRLDDLRNIIQKKRRKINSHRRYRH